MKTQTIRKSVDIHAPREKVWKVIVDDESTRNWYAEFSEGSHAETDWQPGSKVLFTDNSHTGLAGTVISNRPGEELLVRYEGLVVNGKEDYESEEAREVKGGRENYYLMQRDGTTTLSIECDMSESMYDQMSKLWDKALVRIKALAEA